MELPEKYNHYHEWRENRIKTMMKYLGNDFFENKSLLELGCFTGDIGRILHSYGAKVSCCDVRDEHIQQIKSLYPFLYAFQLDCDRSFKIDYFDIIIHFGLLYHLKNIRESLLSLKNRCKYLILETEVCDSQNSDDIIYVKEDGIDQAYHGIGCKPSATLVEKYLDEADFSYKMIMDRDLNSSFHVYDWEVENTRKIRSGLRRFWICTNKNEH
jgi:hypothetical protein